MGTTIGNKYTINSLYVFGSANIISYTSEFIYEMNIWNHEYMNSCIWIQIFVFWIHEWIHKYMNSDRRIHCIIIISLLWIHNMNSLLKIDENSMFWIHNIEFSSEICIWIYCNEFKIIIIQISVMNSFMNWIFMNLRILFHGRVYGSYKKHSAAAQYNQPKQL